MSGTTSRLLPPNEATTSLLTPEVGVRQAALLADVLDLADSEYAARGWNQPYQLLAIAPLAARPKKSRDALSAKATAEGVSFDPDTAVTIAQVPVPGAGELIELIGGARVPAWVDALILTAEAWLAPASSGDEMDPTAGLAPSAHPGRVEVRTTLAVARDGYTLNLATVRGGASALGDGDAAVRPYGRTVDLLLRLMGAPTAPSAWHPEHLSTAVVLKALVDWARDTDHDFGTPGVRALALALALDGYSDGAAPLSAVGALPLTTDLATAFVEMVEPYGASLLVNAVSTADHLGRPIGSMYTPGKWVTAAQMWAEWAAESDDDTWMDAGMYARECFGENVRGATAEELLSTVGAVFGAADADLLRTGLSALGLMGWPVWDLNAHTPIVGGRP